MNSTQYPQECEQGCIGVGLRHEHYTQALAQKACSIDFVELHAENFFAQGGPSRHILEEIKNRYRVSIHGTSMGLGSLAGINDRYLNRFTQLVNEVNPIYVSDHACFTWGEDSGKPLHAGDLLPLKFDTQTLNAIVSNTDRVQQAIGRQLLVENVVTYFSFSNNTFAEAEFLAEVAHRTQCGLLVDLNNILVNLHNQRVQDTTVNALKWLSFLPQEQVKELHLAGSSLPQQGDMIIDDHSKPVSEKCWQLYALAIRHFPKAATLIEWDNDLPTWDVLLQEASRAREIRKATWVSI